MEKATQMPPPPLINAKPSRWVKYADIERHTGMQYDEINILSESISPQSQWLTYKAWIKNDSGAYLLQDGHAIGVYWPCKLIEGSVSRGTMRPDVTIIDNLTKTWRQVGQ